MREILRLVALVVVVLSASFGWFVLGAVMSARTSSQQDALVGAVADLWGQPLEQSAPRLVFEYQEPVVTEVDVLTDGGRPLVVDGKVVKRAETKLEWRTRDEVLASSQITTDLRLDQRRKGLMWFSLYNVDFDGAYTYTHTDAEVGWLTLAFDYPVANGMYDGFQFDVDGASVADDLTATGAGVTYRVPVKPGQTVNFHVAYTSRGLDRFSYRPTAGSTGQIRNFNLTMTTDFRDIDYPAFTMSPSSRTETASGWTLNWTFERLVSANGMGMTMPSRVQPGPLAAQMSFSAPISLALFVLWIYVIGLLRKIDLHPMNHLFVAGAFFAFHLLFGYSVDHLPVEVAFGLSAAVSVFLVVSYLRLVVGAQFAWREAGIAQLVYLVGFSLAHFWDGFTGLTVTVLGIGTLFALMQLTGRIKWSEVFAGKPA